MNRGLYGCTSDSPFTNAAFLMKTHYVPFLIYVKFPFMCFIGNIPSIHGWNMQVNHKDMPHSEKHLIIKTAFKISDAPHYIRPSIEGHLSQKASCMPPQNLYQHISLNSCFRQMARDMTCHVTYVKWSRDQLPLLQPMIKAAAIPGLKRQSILSHLYYLSYASNKYTSWEIRAIDCNRLCQHMGRGWWSRERGGGGLTLLYFTKNCQICTLLYTEYSQKIV